MISNELLKKKILDEAIHGRLIENDPSLKPIDVESINDDIPFEIPNNWKWAKFSNLAECRMGKTILAENLTDNGIPVYSATQENKIFGFVKNSELVLHRGDIVIPARGNSIGYATYILDKEATCTQTTICCQNIKILSKYLYFCCYAFKSLWFHFTGAAIPQITVKQLNKNLVPLPPLEEQEKIVKKIEELFELIDKKEKNNKEKEKLKTLLKEKILDSAIHGKLIENDLSLPAVEVEEVKDNIPFEIPNNWKWSKLGKISDYGKNKKVKGINISKNQWILELEDIEKNTGKILNKIYQVDRNAISDKNMFFRGNLLYGKLRPYLNKCVIADENGFCCTEIEPIVLINNIEVKYVQKVLMSRYFLNYVASCSYGAKMPRLGTKDAKNAMIPIPPLEQQKKIVDKIEKCFELIEQL